MKANISPAVKAHLIRSAFYFLLLVAICAVPFVLAQRNTTEQSVATSTPPNISQAQQSQFPTISGDPTGVRRLPIVPMSKLPAVVLYDQLDNPGINSTNSQEVPDVPSATDFTADDFVVPGGQTWNIMEVDAQGVYFNGSGPADNFNVFFYQDSGGLPGAQVYSATGQSYVNNAGVFQVTLSSPAVLSGGTYWVSVQAHMSSSLGQWGWTNRTVQANNKAAWQNPGGFFPPPPDCPPGCPNPCPLCLTWGLRECCTGSPVGESDQMFRLIGTIGGATPTPTPTATSTPTPTATATPMRPTPTPRARPTPFPRPTP